MEVMRSGQILDVSKGRVDRICWLVRYKGSEKRRGRWSVLFTEVGKTERRRWEGGQGQEFGFGQTK